MENSKQNIKETEKNEDKKNAAFDKSSETEKPVDDSFKTSRVRAAPLATAS